MMIRSTCEPTILVCAVVTPVTNVIAARKGKVGEKKKKSHLLTDGQLKNKRKTQ
jgi:hypothetical protein